MKQDIKTLIGLFLPVPWEHEVSVDPENGLDERKRKETRWGASLAVSGIPIGWIMVAISVVVNLIM